jgi:chorismate--pyruvate lyase
VNFTPFGKHQFEPRWYSHHAGERHGAPAELLHWLLDRASLTARLRAACCGQFRVEVREQGWRRPMLDEARTLGQRPEAYAFVREVHLMCDDEPWVFARTVIPAATLKGGRRRLANLGKRPLGAGLFADRSMRRSPVEIARLCAGQPLFARAVAPLDSAPAAIWGRRSVFRLSGAPLLVSEIFLPGIGISYSNER